MKDDEYRQIAEEMDAAADAMTPQETAQVLLTNADEVAKVLAAAGASTEAIEALMMGARQTVGDEPPAPE
jgi:hypothetical protein